MSTLTTTLNKDYTDDSKRRTDLTEEKVIHCNHEHATAENNSMEDEIPVHHKESEVLNLKVYAAHRDGTPNHLVTNNPGVVYVKGDHSSSSNNDMETTSLDRSE